MKKLTVILGAVLISTAITNAQTLSTNFLQSAEDYFTSFNTNYTWSSITLDAETQVKQSPIGGLSDQVKVAYHLSNFEFIAAAQFNGANTPLNQMEGGVGYDILNHYDTEVTISVLGGYSQEQDSALIEPGIELKKKLTTNTYASIGASMPYYFRRSFSSTPTFTTGVGFTF
jgi:hypothetical protein